MISFGWIIVWIFLISIFLNKIKNVEEIEDKRLRTVFKTTNKLNTASVGWTIVPNDFDFIEETLDEIKVIE